MRITINCETLTDGSQVFNVLLNTIAFHALDEAHALTLADQLGVLIVTHTCDGLDQQGWVGFIGEVRGIKPLI